MNFENRQPPPPPARTTILNFIVDELTAAHAEYTRACDRIKKITNALGLTFEQAQVLVEALNKQRMEQQGGGE